MSGGSANTSTKQDNGIDITTNAGAGSINNYSDLTVKGSKVTNKSSATGAGIKVKAAYSGPPPALQNLYEKPCCKAASGKKSSLMEMYHCSPATLVNLIGKCDDSLMMNLSANTAHPTVLAQLHAKCVNTQTDSHCKSGAAYITASAAAVVLGAAIMC